MTEPNEELTEEGGTDMFWKPGLIIFLCCIPFAAIYAIVSVRRKKKRAVKACVRDMQYWVDAYLKKGQTITLLQLRDAVLPSYDLDTYEQALKEIGIMTTEASLQTSEAEVEEDESQ